MSHPLSAYCYDRLRVGLETLQPNQRKIRAGVEEFLANMRNGGARDLVRRLRRLSLFMRLKRERWPHAVDRLFAMKYDQAETTITKYRRWVGRKQWTSNLKKHMNAWGFVRLSRALKKKGLVSWELKHVLTQARELRWNGCPSGYRERVEEWLRIEQARNLCPATMKRLREELFLLGNWIRSQHLSFELVERSDALSWLESQRARKLSPSTLNHRLAIAKRFYGWLVLEDLIKKSPFDHLGFARLSRKLPRFLEVHEMAQLLTGARPGGDKAALEVMYSSGCRVSELCNLELNQVSMTEKTARTVGKGGHDRVIYLNDSAIRAIRSYLPLRSALSKRADPQDRGALFLNSTGTRFSIMSVRAVLERTLGASKLEKHVSPHMIRHSFATHMLNRGADIYSIMQFLGHRSIESTVRYLQVATARLSEVHRKYHPRP